MGVAAPCRRTHQCVQVDPGLHQPRRLGDQALQRGLLLGLHQPQVAFRHGDAGLLWQRAEHGQPGLRHPRAHQRLVPGAGDPVQDHPRHPHARAEPRQPQRHRRRRLRLTARVDHRDHRPAHPQGQVGRRAVAAGTRAGHPVEQAHRPFRQDQVRPLSRRQHRVQHRPGHGPTVQVVGPPAARRPVKRRVDVIRPVLEGLHRQPPGPQRRQKPQHHRGLAGPAGRGRDDQPRGHDPAPGNRGCVPTGR